MKIIPRSCPGCELRVGRLLTDFNNWNRSIKNYINYTEEVNVIIKFIDREKSLGRVVYEKGEIEIDPRFTLLQLRNTLVHELIHYEQYREKRLEIKNDEWFWKGKKYDNSLVYEEYTNLPWEIEARKRSKKIIDKLFKIY